MLDVVFQIPLNLRAIDDAISDFKLVRGFTIVQYTSVQLCALPTESTTLYTYVYHPTSDASLSDWPTPVFLPFWVFLLRYLSDGPSPGTPLRYLSAIISIIADL